MTTVREDGRTRLEGAAATLLIHAAILLGLLWGLDSPLPRLVRDPLAVFDIAPPPAPRPERPRPPPRREDAANSRRASPGREGAASPPNLRSEATPVVAPPPIVPLPVPSPIIAATLAGRGADPSSGAAEIRGPGTGAGGFGNGRGSGYGGDGGGGGGGFGANRPPRQTRGQLRYSDHPHSSAGEGAGGTVWVRYIVTVEGRAVGCRITRSSGDQELDATTCRLIEQRFRFEPSRDWQGRPIQSQLVERHSWGREEESPDDDDRY